MDHAGLSAGRRCSRSALSRVSGTPHGWLDRWQHRFQHLPLRLGQITTSHTRPNGRTRSQARSSRADWTPVLCHDDAGLAPARADARRSPISTAERLPGPEPTGTNVPYRHRKSGGRCSGLLVAPWPALARPGSTSIAMDLFDPPNGALEPVELPLATASADTNRTVDGLANKFRGSSSRPLTSHSAAAEGVDPASVITSLADATRRRLGARNEHKHGDLSSSEHAHHGLSPGGRRRRSRRSSGGRRVRIRTSAQNGGSPPPPSIVTAPTTSTLR